VGPSGTDWKKPSVEASDIKVLSLDLILRKSYRNNVRRQKLVNELALVKQSNDTRNIGDPSGTVWTRHGEEMMKWRVESSTAGRAC